MCATSTAAEGGSAIKVPPAPSGRRQLRAVMHKNLLLKRRAWKTSCCEILAPALLMSVLVLGYSLSEKEYISAAIYAMTTLELGPLAQALTPILDPNYEPPVPCEAGDCGGYHRRLALVGDDSVLRRQRRSRRRLHEWCYVPGEPNKTLVPDGGCQDDVDLIALRGDLTALLNGPLPVLPIDTFLGVSRAIDPLLGENSKRLLTEFDSYLNLFGNILSPGALHLSPDSPSVRSFVAYSRARHPSLRNVSMRVHADEDTALAAVLDPADGERAWALLNFDALNATTVDYQIRLNYSTVPNTNRLVRFIARGLDTLYQRYTTSGYFTLQQVRATVALPPTHAAHPAHL